MLEVYPLFGIHKTRTTPYHPLSDGFKEQSFRKLGRCLKGACRETKQEWDKLVPLITMSYRATPQASTGVTPNMMMLGRQTQLPVQAMYGTPLGPKEEETTVSEYVAALQGGCERRTDTPVRGYNERRCIKNMTTTVKFRGKNTKLESWYGFTT